MEKDRALNFLQNGLLPQVHGEYYEALKMAIDNWQMEPCEDCISRQAVLNTAKYRIVIQETRTGLIEKRGYFVDIDDIKAMVRVLPKKKEITMEDVEAYCESRNLVVLTKELFDQMNNTADKFYLYLKDGKTMIRVLDSTTLNNSEKPNKWIPVSERFPEEETDVLICNADGNIEITSGSYSTELKNEFIWYTTTWGFGEVVAWMPLPEPWKEGKE